MMSIHLRSLFRVSLLPLGLVAQFALLAIWIVGSNARSATEPISAPQIPAPDGSTPLTAEGGQALAQEYANRWAPEARLIAVTMRLDWPANGNVLNAGELPSTGWLIYTFTNGDKTLSVYLDRGTAYYLAGAKSEFGAGDWPLLDLTTYPRSSVIATAAADITNGHQYRSACPESRTTAFVTATSVMNADGTSMPVWTVTYGDSRFGGTFDVIVQMDAVAGDVIRNEVRDRAC